MKVLITGISGFIGSGIFQRFKEYDLYTIDNLSFGNKDLININSYKFHIEDIRNRTKIFEVMELVKPDWVIHLAAIHFIPYCNQYPFESSQVNIQGTKNILDACEATPSVKKVFYASTAAVYPNYDGPISESILPGPLDIYGLSKLTGEYLCKSYHQKTGIPTLVCRFFNAFGPNETNPHLIPTIQEQIKLGKREIALGNLEPKRDYIHTSDMANAIYMLLNKFEKGFDVFNLGQGQEYSVLEIVEAFEKCLGEKITVVQDPSRIRKAERMHLLADVSKIKTYTGWEPKISIIDGIRTLLYET